MPQSYKILIKLFIAFILLAIGGFIYYTFRTKELLMFDWANRVGLGNFIDITRTNLSHIEIPIFVKYCLPNALWCTSYIIASDTLISTDNHRLEWAISLPIVATILELFQAFNLIPGTFDIMDLCCFLIPTAIYIAYHKSVHMKKTLKKIAPAVLLAAYSIIAGGSLEDIGITLAIVGAVLVIGVIWASISGSKAEKQKREQGLAKATDNFGSYTHQVEYSLGKYILYDEPTHRILLKESISDSRKLRELKTTKRAPGTKVTYKEETVTTTSAGSAIGRGVAGAVLLGPVGAIVGAAIAKKKTETKKTPEYHTISGYYTIEVIDIEGNTRAFYGTSKESKHEEVYRFFQNIIDKNLEPERIAHKIDAAENCNAIQAINASSVVVGSNIKLIQGLLINSTKTTDDDGENYILCSEVVTVINKGWGSSFDEVRVKVKNNLLCKLIGLSKNYTVGTFKNLILDAHMLSQQIVSQYGAPSRQCEEISYTEFTDDNNRTIAYDWSESCNQTLKIDYIYDKGKFKYEFISEI